MPRKITRIRDITPRGPPNWIAKVMVLEKFPTRGPSDSPKRQQKYILADAEGTRVQATVWGDFIGIFGRRLKIYSSYYISKALVKICLPEYQFVSNNFEWTIHGRTVIEDCKDDNFEEIIPDFKFAPFSVFTQYVKSPVELDVLGIVLSMQLPRYIPKEGGQNVVQEAVILDRELQPILITFWDNIINQECVHLYARQADHPVVAIFRVRVVPYNGMSLATRSSTSLSIEPPIAEALELKQWYNTNKEGIDILFNPNDYFSSPENDVPMNAVETKSLKVAASMPSNTTFWTKATIALVDYSQRFYFMCCPKCKKSTGSNPGDAFTCNYCSVQNVIPIPRCIVQLQLSDDTGEMSAYAYGDVAENILNCTAVQLMEILAAGNHEAVKSVATVEVGVLMLIQIKITQNHFEHNCAKRFNIYETHLLLGEEKISKLGGGELKVDAVDAVQSTASVGSASTDPPFVPEKSQEKIEDFLNEVLVQPSQPGAPVRSAIVEPHCVSEILNSEIGVSFSAVNKSEDVGDSNPVIPAGEAGD